MTDSRLTPANTRVAAAELEGQIDAPRFAEGTLRQIGVSVADLWGSPECRMRQRQLLYGEHLRVLDDFAGMAFVQSKKDGYVGYVASSALIVPADMTHRVCVPATHLYQYPDIKRPEVTWMSFGARLRVVSAQGNFFETDQGLFVPKPHLRPLTVPLRDPVTVAQMHFGVPYLWGGNSVQGIDCSGLVQAALLSCGIDCPGDTDMQQAALGTELPPGTAPERGDLVFWKGHVALAVDGETLIHANGHHMAVAYEPIQDTITRIETQGEGPVTGHKRL
ncbi:C40 family peptidase [Actibacterium sp. D379-3]